MFTGVLLVVTFGVSFLLGYTAGHRAPSKITVRRQGESLESYAQRLSRG